MKSTNPPANARTLPQAPDAPKADAEAILAAATTFSQVDFIAFNAEGEAVELGALSIPYGRRVVSVAPLKEALAGAPSRTVGTAKFLDTASFVAHVNRYKVKEGASAATSLFAEPDAARVTAVYDYPAAAAPNWGGHRAVVTLRRSEEWQRWCAQAGRGMSPTEFAEFLEANIADVYQGEALGEETRALLAMLDCRTASPAQLVALSRNLHVNADVSVRNALTLSSGEVQLQYAETHQTSDGSGQPIKVPNAFLIAIPVFFNGPRFQLLVRLRYRLRDGRITWTYDVHRAALAEADAFREICDGIAKETDLPVWVGEPEPAIVQATSVTL